MTAAADQRAEALLARHVGDVTEVLRRGRLIEMIDGREYQIMPTGVYLRDSTNREYFTSGFCLWTPGVPDADAMLTLLLLLRHRADFRQALLTGATAPPAGTYREDAFDDDPLDDDDD